MRLAAFPLLLLTAPAVFAQADESARQVLDDCVESLRYDVAGMAAIEAACPGLEAALVELGVAPFLSDPQREALGLNGLMNLQNLVQRYSEAPEAGAVAVDSLRPVLDSLQKPARVEQPPTWLERFRRWLRNLVDNDKASAAPWLSRWLDKYQLSETMRNVLFYGSLLLVVALAVAVIVNEVRVARSGRRKKSAGTTLNQAVGAAGEAVSGQLDLDAAARGDRPSLVFRMLVATLVQTGRLQTGRSLTHRELTAKARFDDPQQRECFRRVAALAERIVYGRGAVATDDLDYVVQAGRSLNSQLGGAAS